MFRLTEVKYPLPVSIQIRFIRRHFTPKIFSFYIPVFLVTTGYVFLYILIEDLLKLAKIDQVQGDVFTKISVRIFHDVCLIKSFQFYVRIQYNNKTVGGKKVSP